MKNPTSKKIRDYPKHIQELIYAESNIQNKYPGQNSSIAGTDVLDWEGTTQGFQFWSNIFNNNIYPKGKDIDNFSII